MPITFHLQTRMFFRAGYTTVNKLITYNDVSCCIDEGMTVDLLMLDVRKAYDRVVHRILPSKIADYGVPCLVIDWIEIFLSRRKMRFRLPGALSREVPVESCVPQGSILGPTLFLIYITHRIKDISKKFMIYADDIKMYLRLKMAGPENRVAVTQSDTDKFVIKNGSWGLRMSPDIFNSLRFTKRSMEPVEGESSVHGIEGIFIPFEKIPL